MKILFLVCHGFSEVSGIKLFLKKKPVNLYFER